MAVGDQKGAASRDEGNARSNAVDPTFGKRVTGHVSDDRDRWEGGGRSTIPHRNAAGWRHGASDSRCGGLERENRVSDCADIFYGLAHERAGALLLC